MAFKAPLGMSPYKVVFRRPCHLLVELEHQPWWAIQAPNFDLTAAGEARKLSLNELEEIRREAYDNTRLIKERAKFFHDKLISSLIGNSCLQAKRCYCMIPTFTCFPKSYDLGGLVLTLRLDCFPM